MSGMIRLDKYLADMGIGTRSEVKSYIRRGRVTVNGEIVKQSDLKIGVDQSEVLFDQTKVEYEQYEYIMLNKPAGVVSATTDNLSKTVIELITDTNNKDLFPVGRLDKDTEGLLLITNDGNLAHQLLSPKKHVPKVYYAKVLGQVTNEDIHAFKKGIQIDDSFTALPAKLKILESDIISTVHITIYEGKFHQVKRMFEAVDKKVTYLKRLRMGSLLLDESLKAGEYRKLTKEEINLLNKE